MDPSEYHNVARHEERHWWYTGMVGIAAAALRRIGLPDRARILDAGCGTGGGMRWLEPFGRIHGIDVHPAALELAKAGGADRLACADVRTLPFADGSFDVLTSFDVLCQLPRPDDARALREFARVLRPGGWVLLRLPAHEWLHSAHDRFVHTRQRYTRGEVSAMLQYAGLSPVRLTYANCLLFLPAAVWRLARRNSVAASDVRPLHAALNALLGALLHAEAAWLSRFNFPIGLSVVAIAQKGPA